MCLDAEPFQFLNRAIFFEHGTWNAADCPFIDPD
jgi:hypothetical protein